MTLKQYLILMTVGTFVCYATLGFIVFTIDPANAGFIGFLFFYVSLFLAILGTFSVLGFIARAHLARDDEAVFRQVRRTFRQGAIIASFFILLLLLRASGYLNSWNAALLVGLFLILESVIFTNRKYSNRDLKRFTGE